MKRFIICLFPILLMVACSPGAPSEADIQTAIAQTAEAVPADQSDEPTKTPTAPRPTATPKRVKLPTETPRPTYTPELAATLAPPFPVLDEESLSWLTYGYDEVTGNVSIGYEVPTRPNQKMQAGVAIEADGTLDWFWAGSYFGDDWLFINSIIINADDVVYELPLCFYDDSILDGGTVSEFFAICTDWLTKDRVKAIAFSDESIVRFQGSDGKKDYELTPDEKISLVLAVQLYSNLKEGQIRVKDNSRIAGGKDWWEYSNE